MRYLLADAAQSPESAAFEGTPPMTNDLTAAIAGLTVGSHIMAL